MIGASIAEREPEPIEIDPRRCQLCGLTIDQHEMVDSGEGPEFFCAETTEPPHWLTESIMRQWELADPRDAWRHAGEPAPPASVRNSDISGRPPSRPQPRRTPQATIDAFWYVVRLDDPDRLARWLADHKADAAYLHEVWGKKCATAA